MEYLVAFLIIAVVVLYFKINSLKSKLREVSGNIDYHNQGYTDRINLLDGRVNAIEHTLNNNEQGSLSPLRLASANIFNLLLDYLNLEIKKEEFIPAKLVKKAKK